MLRVLFWVVCFWVSKCDRLFVVVLRFKKLLGKCMEIMVVSVCDLKDLLVSSFLLWVG